jgi:polyhydroxybutyrate depolymerase
MNLGRFVVPLAFILVASAGITACSDADGGSNRLRAGKSKSAGPAEGTAAPETSPGGGGTSPAPSTGCNGGAPKAATSGLATNLSLVVQGNTRTYDLSVPAGYDSTRPYPLVFVFHGSGGDAEGVRNTFGFEDVAGGNAVFVYPNGRDNQWNLDDPADSNDDVALFDALVPQLGTQLCLDSTRVFATGFSNGAFFANQLGCHRGDKLRAIASHGGGGPYGSDDRYDDEGHLVCTGKPPAVLFIHGEDDGAVSLSNAESGLAHWRWASSCSAGSSSRQPEPCVAYDGCSKPVVWCSIQGLGHDVWGAGTQATWDFFKGF